MLNICICQIIKDEQRYIEEWINYYINLGISKFVLFEDWNSSSHKEVLSKYGDKIILHKFSEINDNDKKDKYRLRQDLVWRCFYRLYKDKFDACFFIDPDEYLQCNKEQFFNEIENIYNNDNAKIIRYFWQCMTASGHIKDPYPNQKYSIVNTYKDKYINDESELNNNLKCLIFLNRINSYKEFDLVPHGPYIGDHIHYSQYRLNHYLTKSWEEYKWRLLQKGEPIEYELNQFARKLEDFFVINEDLQQYKEQLLKECEGLEYKYNDYN